MNEKIKELAERASSRYDQAPGIKLILNPEKFAELIVRECIDVVESQKAKMSYGPTFVIEDIKQHFGVEDERK